MRIEPSFLMELEWEWTEQKQFSWIIYNFHYYYCNVFWRWCMQGYTANFCDFTPISRLINIKDIIYYDRSIAFIATVPHQVDAVTSTIQFWEVPGAYTHIILRWSTGFWILIRFSDVNLVGQHSRRFNQNTRINWATSRTWMDTLWGGLLSNVSLA